MPRVAAVPRASPKADIAPMLGAAAAHLERFDFGSALQLYQQALVAQPGNAAAAMGMAMALNRTGKPGEALDLLQRVWKGLMTVKPKPGPQQQGVVLAQIGLAQQQLGKLSEALESYRQAARLVRSADLDRRIRELEPLASSSLPVQQLILQGRQLQAQRQLQEAANTYRAALQLQQDSVEALHGLALVLREVEQHDEALPLLQKAVILAPQRPDLFNDIGMLFQQRMDFAKAASFHKRAIKLDPSFVHAHVNLGVAHKRLGQMDESVAAYRKALEIDPRSPEAHNNLGNVLRAVGALKEARAHLEQAVSLRPGYADAKANLDMVLQALAEAAPTKPRPAKAPAGKAAPAKSAAKAKPPAKKAAPAKSAAKKKRR